MVSLLFYLSRFLDDLGVIVEDSGFSSRACHLVTRHVITL